MASEPNEIPLFRDLQRECAGCGARLKIDLAGLGPKTDIGCPCCGKIERVAAKHLRKFRQSLADGYATLLNTPGMETELAAVRRAWSDVRCATAKPYAAVALVTDEDDAFLAAQLTRKTSIAEEDRRTRKLAADMIAAR